MIRTVSTAFFFALLAASPALGETPVGDWTGAVATPTGAVGIAFHVRTGPDGGLVGLADSPEQGAEPVVLANVAAQGDGLSFDLPAAGGHFDGHWNAEAGQWMGLWTEGRSTLPLNLRRGRLARPLRPAVAGLDGDWTGVIVAEPSMRLRMTYHIRTDQGGTTVLSENPDHLANGATAETVARIGDHVILSMNVVDGEVQANLIDDGQVMIGALTQAGQQYPLRLTRVP